MVGFPNQIQSLYGIIIGLFFFLFFSFPFGFFFFFFDNKEKKTLLKINTTVNFHSTEMEENHSDYTTKPLTTLHRGGQR
jgi:hypothetical protein